MDNAHFLNALKELKDIHMPITDVSIWPLAPGWWIVITVLSLAAYFSIRYYIKVTESMKRRAEDELAKIKAKFEQNNDFKELAINISALLKRVAIVKFGYNEVASLHGREWLEFLQNNSNPNDAKKFDNTFAKIIAEAPYAPENYNFSKIFDDNDKNNLDDLITSFLSSTEQWIRHNL
ncbi:MAG: DUF4381 domain-containing protein [Alphaproteobacteria bacterium]|nr:DUF4381 domain-containing protein [Alphaproteobacteria bacterium]